MAISRLQIDTTPNHEAKPIDRTGPAPLEAALARLRNGPAARYPGLAHGSALTLAQAPEPTQGWNARDFRLLRPRDNSRFVMPDKYREDYSDFVERFWEAKQLWDDRPKLMLKTLPELSGVQSPVHLYTARTSYSVVRFYQDQMAEHDKQSALDELLLGDGTVRFAHSLSLHLIVVTADRRILLTHRSPGVGYRAQTWSVSIEEQLETADLGDASGEASMVNWYRRALTEELALVEGKHFDEDAIRVMSLFLESDLPNVAISAVTHVTVDSEELTAILRVKAPENEEFRSWAYLRADRPEVLRELLRPSRKYHPTSGYRLLCAYQRLFGWPTEADLDIATK